ncbi:MAG: glucoamylase family protein [Culicoidibacterales bacterium]
MIQKQNSPEFFVTDQATIELSPVVMQEAKSSFDFFWEQANVNEDSPGYGLIRDRYPTNSQLASIASVGFGLNAIIIGIENNWITYAEGEERAKQTLMMLWEHAEQEHGFFYHFLNMKTAKRSPGSEVSVIDTALLVSGALTVGAYFQGDIQKLATDIYKRVEWDWFVDDNKKMFYMGYTPENGFSGHWDVYGEQLIMYILGAGSPTHPIDSEIYYNFKRLTGSYGTSGEFIHSWFGSLFTHQYSHAFIDFRHIVDRDGVNWFDNSVTASYASQLYAIDQHEKHTSLSALSWGLTASDSQKGYEGKYGSAPSGVDNTAHFVDGTMMPAGAIGSIVFTPEASIAALEHYYTLPKLVGKYGLYDAFNEDNNWYATDVIGIDKGISLTMIENYRSGLVWEMLMSNKYIQKGLGLLEFKQIS